MLWMDHMHHKLKFWNQLWIFHMSNAKCNLFCCLFGIFNTVLTFFESFCVFTWIFAIHSHSEMQLMHSIGLEPQQNVCWRFWVLTHFTHKVPSKVGVPLWFVCDARKFFTSVVSVRDVDRDKKWCEMRNFTADWSIVDAEAHFACFHANGEKPLDFWKSTQFNK